MIWRISKRAFSLSKKRHIWHHHLKNRAVSFCPMYHFAPVSPISYRSDRSVLAKMRTSAHKTAGTSLSCHIHNMGGPG